MIDAYDYTLNLSTGEVLLVSELDPERVGAMRNPEVLRHADPVLSLCTRASRAVLEDAKIGGTDALEDALGTPPEGCLLKLSVPVCRHVAGRSCSMADAGRCTTRSRDRRGPDFPVCWELDIPGGLTEASVAAGYLTSRVVSAWRELRYVIVVDG